MAQLLDQRGIMNEAERCANTLRPLTHSLDLSKEGLAMKATCSVDDCAKPVHARGWCSMHNWRWANHGDVNWTPPARPTACSVDDCGNTGTLRRGMCDKHYNRSKRTGTTELRDFWTPQLVSARFWSTVDKSAGPKECWPWQGDVSTEGYGRFSVRGRRFGAHRFAYELTKGRIPDGLTIDHVKAWGCTRTDCCNPAHLEAVTMAENLRRSEAASAVNSRKTECPRCGSAYDLDANGRRFCAPCRRAWKPRGAS